MIGESLTLTLTPVTGSPRRLRIEPSERPDVSHRLTEERWAGERWVQAGTEDLRHVEIARMLRTHTESKEDGLNQPHRTYRGP